MFMSAAQKTSYIIFKSALLNMWCVCMQHGGMETQGQETRGHGDMGARRHGGMETCVPVSQ